MVRLRLTGWRAALAGRLPLNDALLAVGLYAADNALLLLAPSSLWPANWPLALGWSALGMAPVVVRRRWPWLAIVALTVHTTLSLAIPLHTQSLAIVVIAYTAAAQLGTWPAVGATVLLWVPGITIAVMTRAYSESPLESYPGLFVAFNAMAALVCYLIGRIVFTRRRYVAALEERAWGAEQNQRALAAQAVADERRRIARELHDMVAHHVSVMGVLATGSRRALARDPAATDEALATIEETSRTALREMRRLLDVLRTDPEPMGELAPQPGLAGLVPLVEQVREAGLPVRLHADNAPPAEPVEPGLALAIYRIVQEALTNALKHAGPGASAEVRLWPEGRAMVVEVLDTGRGPAPGPGRVGHGLLGMQERVALYGGTLWTGPRPGGGFRVWAKLPLEEAPA